MHALEARYPREGRGLFVFLACAAPCRLAPDPKKLWEREYKGEIADTVEMAHYKLDPENAGKLDAHTSESQRALMHFIGTCEGMTCHYIWRGPESKRGVSQRHTLATKT